MAQATTAMEQAIRALHETVTAAALDQAPRAIRKSASLLVKIGSEAPNRQA